MSYGLPVVATTPSIEGMHLTPGRRRAGRRRSGELCRCGGARVSRPGAVGTARRGRAREHPPPFLARRRAAAIGELLMLASGARPAIGRLRIDSTRGPRRRGRARRSFSAARTPGPTRRDRASGRGARTWSADDTPVAARTNPARVGQQRLGAQRCQNLGRVFLPVGRDVQVAARRQALGESVHELGSEAGAACDASSSATDRGRKHGSRQARPARACRSTTSTASCWTMRMLARRFSLDQLQQAADAGTVNFDRQKIVDRAALRDRRRRLAHAEADFEDLRVVAAENAGRDRAASEQRECRSAAAAPRTRAAAPARSAPGAAQSFESAGAAVARDRVHQHKAPARSRLLTAGSRRDPLPDRVGQLARDRAGAPAGRRVLDRQRVRILPRRGHIRPGLARRPAQFLAQAVARDAPYRNFVDAMLRAYIRGGDVQAVRRELRLRGQIEGAGSFAAGARSWRLSPTVSRAPRR